MNSFKSTAKYLVTNALAIVAPVVWSFGKDRLLILTYHRVLPRSAADDHSIEPGMFVFEDTFEMHIRTLRKYFKIVDLAEWLSLETKPANRCCAITFDDGWRDNFDHAFPLLQKYTAPATIFVVSELVGTDARFWPDRLGNALVRFLTNTHAAESSSASLSWLADLKRAANVPETNFSREDISRVVQLAKSMDPREVEYHLDHLEDQETSSADTTHVDLLNWQQIEQMLESGLVSIGSHTRRHTRLLDGVPDANLRDEIIQSRKDIEAAIDTPVEVFCYPNGDRNARAAELVREHYRAACTTSVHWNTPANSAFELGRITMHEDSSNTKQRLLANLTGWA